MGHLADLAGWPGYRTVPGGSSWVKKPGDRKSLIRDLPIYTEIIGELTPELSSLELCGDLDGGLEFWKNIEANARISTARQVSLRG